MPVAGDLRQQQCKPWTALSTQQKQEVTTALSNFDCPAAQTEPDEATKPSYYIACDTSSQIVYLLGTVIVRGQQIDEANAQAPNISNGQPGWSVSLQLGSSGGDRVVRLDEEVQHRRHQLERPDPQPGDLRRRRLEPRARTTSGSPSTGRSSRSRSPRPR